MDETLVIRGVALSGKAVDRIVEGARKKTAELGIPMCVAVCDASGYLLAFWRSERARLGNIRMAIVKASGAALRQRATADELKMRPDDPTQTIRMTLAAGADSVTTLSGGLPIVIGDEIVGAIGVSGGHREQDVAIAQAGIDALGL